MRSILTIMAVLLVGGQLTKIDKPSETGTASVSLGIKLRLGMPKGYVVTQLSDFYRLRKTAASDDNWIVEEKSEAGRPVGDVEFKNDKLAFVSRTWATGHIGESGDLARAIHGLAKQFVDEGNTECHLAINTSIRPDSEGKFVYLTCGPKILEVSHYAILDGPDKGEYAGVGESLGSR